MDNFLIEYRDPMFGIIILFSLVFIISFVNYWWGIFKSKEEKNSIERFVKKFEIASDEKEYKKLLENSSIPTESLALLASAYAKSGDYEKAINIYLVALKRVKGKDKKQYLLSSLGKTYFMAGFLRRSSEVFLESLRLHPRNEESLKYLTVVYEKLKEYDKAIEVLDALEELGADIKRQREYLKALKVFSSDVLSNSQKVEKLKKYAQREPFLQRKYFEFLQRNAIAIDKEEFKRFDYKRLIDLLWYMDEKYLDLREFDDKLLNQLLMAKGVLEFEKYEDSVFELDVLGILKRDEIIKATLSFQYMCNSCKRVFPIHFYRCPNCHEIDSTEIQMSVVKESDEKNIPFL